MPAALLRRLLLASLAALLVGTGLHAPPASAAPPRAPGRVLLAEDDPVPVPPLVTGTWDGKTGIDTSNERWRKAVSDVAELSPYQEVRDAALAALATGDPKAVLQFATVTKPQLEKQVDARKKQEAADNLAKIKAMAGTGGQYFNDEVQRVLKGTDGDREAFLAYGADVARARDQKIAANAQERATQLRDRLRVLVAGAAAGSQLKAAAEQALAGDDAAVAAFWSTGYLAAAKADAAAREQYLKDLEARNKAAEDLSELAQRAKRASEARTRMLAAHGEAVRALQRSANAMGGAANAARHAERVLAGAGTAASKTAELNAAKAQTANQVLAARQAAEQARTSAAIADTASNDLIDTGLTYGAEWSLIVDGMSEAAAAAVGASTTAASAVDATIATNNAQGAQAQAEAHAKQAEQWRKLAQEHAATAKKLAAAAERQAAAAKTAAARTKVARQQAEAAEAKAEAAAARARQHRQTAEAEAENARQARIVAERERANAAAARQRAEEQAAVARSARGNADAQAAIAAGARQRSDAAAGAANAARDRAWDQENLAGEARDSALQAERDEQTAKAKAAALRANAAAQASGAERDEAQRQADEADRDAGVAGTAARSARASANQATGAAANARAAANQADQAAERAWAAAEQAQAAAARADAAADAAEADARAAHSARMRAEARAAEATRQEIKAAEAARAAVRLAEQAADEAVESLWAANRTRDEALAATTEAVAAAAQAEIAVTAAAAARQSASGLAEPANDALGMVSPFTGSDIDADFVAQVAEQAKTIGEEQAAAAEQRAAEALLAAQKAQDAADRANDQVKPAYDAAAQAASSASAAAKSAAEAKKAAAQAAADGAAARTAAANAAKADEQARADAAAARQAANEAANDAAIAGRSAEAAQKDADAANSAASAAEADAAAARKSADSAEADAAAARTSADQAQKYADDAKVAAATAFQEAAEAQQAYERTEAAERARAEKEMAESLDGDPTTPEEEQEILAGLSPEDQELYKQMKAEGDQNILDFIKANAGDLVLSLLGLDDIKGCFVDGNISACLWTLVNFIPVGKLLGSGAKLVKQLAELLPKAKKFIEGIKAAKNKLADLKLLARRGCKGNSFLPGTRVLLAGGGTKPIEQVRIGDRVLATDPVAGRTAGEPVTDTIRGYGEKKLVDVTIDVDGSRGHRTATVTATGNHPFWVPALSQWVEAGNLSVHQWLRTSAGTRVQISAVRPHTATATVHNLTVAEIHTFYVVAGGTPVLVHNCPYGELDEHGRATAMSTTIDPSMLGGKTKKPSFNPAGWEKDKGYNRSHLLGAQLGGSNTDRRNFVTMYQYANTPVMRDIEGRVREAVEKGELVQYEVTPIYRGSDPIPLGVTIRANGNKGFEIFQTIVNRKGP
ncbi:DNA/RNA non-specific endonuclease [Actinoplanes sp. URMC 104]|uniref:DNA/RNA non-specific endonuclease n=1 Tax=Actinoplanes sp. URMC 104 TaxID=3423409 RepID=UPI003F1AC9E4